jgi:hypothetical protein
MQLQKLNNFFQHIHGFPKARSMAQVASLPFTYHKNPYHLFQDFRTKIYGAQKQTPNAKDIGLDKGTYSRWLQEDYIDIGPDEERRRHNPSLKSINTFFADRLTVRKFDILDGQDRAQIETELAYQYPSADHERFGDRVLGVFRGVWQVFSPSARVEQISTGKQFIRSSLFVFHGFRTRVEAAQEIDLLWIGRTTTWKARAVTEEGHNILYIYAKECRTLEHKFFSFYVPGLHDPQRNLHIGKMEGVMAGTVLDNYYNGDYPAAAVPCVARKLVGWSQWFRLNDRLLDSKFVSELKASVSADVACDYHALSDLETKSHRRAFAGDIEDERQRNDECSYNLGPLLRTLFGEGESSIATIMRGVRASY